LKTIHHATYARSILFWNEKLDRPRIDVAGQRLDCIRKPGDASTCGPPLVCVASVKWRWQHILRDELALVSLPFSVHFVFASFCLTGYNVAISGHTRHSLCDRKLGGPSFLRPFNSGDRQFSGVYSLGRSLTSTKLRIYVTCLTQPRF